MALTPVPLVKINGSAIRCDAAALETEPVVVRGFSIKWGRAEYMDPGVEPASTTIYLVDASGRWAQMIRDSAAIGSPVIIQWSAQSDAGTTVGPVVMFRGRVTTSKATPQGWGTGTGKRAWLVELTAADRTADYGNALAGAEPWPAETMIDRAIRVRDLGNAGGAGISQVYFWPGYVDSPVSPLDANGKSALELMGAFYASMGNDSYAYDPDENVIRQAIRLAQPIDIHLGSFDDNLGAVLPVASDVTVDNKVYPGVGLGGCELVGEPVIEATTASEINRLECRWKDKTNDYGDVVSVHDMLTPGDARRVLAWESWLSDGVAIDPTLENVAARAREEGRRPRHPQIATPWSFTFVTERMARFMLQCWENTRLAYISGSLAWQWLMSDAVGYMPVVAPIGGETDWDPKRGWRATLSVHWVYDSTPSSSSATWSALQQIKTSTSTPSVPWWWSILGIPMPAPVSVGQPTPERDLTWGEAAGAGYRFDSSVTWGDMQNVPPTGTQIIDHIN